MRDDEQDSPNGKTQKKKTMERWRKKSEMPYNRLIGGGGTRRQETTIEAEGLSNWQI